jgi:predicted enzyme related to lactoylglutathione lyase
MVERNAPWPAGTPAWVGLATDNPEAAAVFYGLLFGWECEHQGTRDYWLCKLDGEDVSGIGPKHPGTEHLPSRWTTFLATDQVERTAEAITEHGGRVLLEPKDIAPHGRMALAADPNQAIFGLWQASDHIGTDRCTKPGRLVWSEALSRGYEVSKEFYTAVFGYRVEEFSSADSRIDQYADARYAALYADGKPVAGAGEFHRDLPTDTSPHWLPYFSTADTDATVDQVQRTGGRLLGEPGDTDFGRLAILQDPESAVFAVIQLG